MEVVTVRVEEPDPLREAGLKVADAPAGRPAVTLRAAVPEKPLMADTDRENVAFCPGLTVLEAGVTERLKSGTLSVVPEVEAVKEGLVYWE